MTEPDSSRRVAAVLLAGYLAALGIGVLWPLEVPNSTAALEPPSPAGLVADGLRNLVLFVPLGALLCTLGVTIAACIPLALLLSIAIELAQHFVPGRFSTAADVVTNTIGAAIGAALFVGRMQWLAPRPLLAVTLSTSFLALEVGWLVLGVVLLHPTFGRPDYYAGLCPDLGHYERYGGHILSAHLGREPLHSGRLVAGRSIGAALHARDPLRVEFRTGPSTKDLAPLVTIYDGDQREILVLAVEGDDIVVSWQTVAQRFGFERPMHRWVDALVGIRPGTPVSLELTRRREAVSLALDRRVLGELNWTPGRLWMLLVSRDIVPPALAPWLDSISIGLLALPGFFFTRRPYLVILLFGLVLLVLPGLGPAAGAGASEWLGLLIGGGSGYLAGHFVARSISSSSSANALLLVR